MRKLNIGLVFLLVLFGVVFRAAFRAVGAVSPQAEQTPSPTEGLKPSVQSLDDVEQAILNELLRRQDTFAYSAFATQVDRILISQDARFASAWMILTDPVTGQAIPSEPGLALLEWINGSWQVALPGDPDWAIRLAQAPGDIISPDEKSYWEEINADYIAALPTVPLSGYLLPWEGGKTAKLSGSVSHDAYIESGNAHYSFDFYVPGTSSSVLFDLYAARAGTVWRFRDSQANGNEATPGNYIVLQDTTTSPTTYQLYLHLAQASIPPGLKTVGVPVVQGQFIGVADDTGYSTGNHVHFQVHTNPDSYWGRAVDIVFNDVAINGGRPRVQDQFYNDAVWCLWPDDVCDIFQSAYVSGNRRVSPASALVPLAPVQSSTAIRLSWMSQAASSEIDHFDMQHSIDTGPWQDVATNISGYTSYQWVVVEPGHLYAYRMRAVDVAGHVEEYPLVEETVTFVPDASSLCANPDSYEADYSPDVAILVNIGDPAQEHNFCGTQQAGNFMDDQDWVRIPVVSGEPFSVLALPVLNGAAYPRLTLFTQSGDGIVELMSAVSAGFGSPAWIGFTPQASGHLFVRIQSQDGRVIGEGTGYLLYVYPGPPRVVWLPAIYR